jgi:hypothetical protein
LHFRSAQEANTRNFEALFQSCLLVKPSLTHQSFNSKDSLNESDWDHLLTESLSTHNIKDFNECQMDSDSAIESYLPNPSVQR